MVEGYVDVRELQLWRENHRLVLAVAEFEERNGRPPDAEELVKLMHGAILLTGTKSTTPSSSSRWPTASPARASRSRRSSPSTASPRTATVVSPRRCSSSTARTTRRPRRIAPATSACGAPRTRRPRTNSSRSSSPATSKATTRNPGQSSSRGDSSSRSTTAQGQIQGRITRAELKRIREELAKDFAIKPREVDRYDKMVYWADDFSAYHEEQDGTRPPSVHTPRRTSSGSMSWTPATATRSSLASWRPTTS